jgi:lipopolysaccharide transport protein LptA
MRRNAIILLAGLLLFSACSKRKERSAKEEAEWNKIQPVAQSPKKESVLVSQSVVSDPNLKKKNYDGLVARLKQMQLIKRKKGEALLTGDALVFDYKRRVVRMDGKVQVLDDRGLLEADSLTGRFSESNEVEIIEARRNVKIKSQGRVARAQVALYTVTSGAIELKGKASVSDQTYKMQGERIFFWMKGDRRMVCEPNAYFQLKGSGGLSQISDKVQTNSTKRMTEIWANRVVFDEKKSLIEMEGNIRLRDKQAAMNCDMVRIFLQGTNQVSRIEARSNVRAWSGTRKLRADRAVYQSETQDIVLKGNVRVSNEQATMDCGQLHVYLKGTNEIDWIEARFDVIIQSGERKAIAGKASYYVEKEKIVLEENPKMMQGKNIMTGDRITFWTKNRRMVCEPNARLLLYPDENTKLKFMKDLNK